MAGERGSADTVRDVRGFAVKFYTDEGNWDLVGNNIPVFFIQDAMKFPDLVHAVKPEPHFAMPQASSAHDTFWDFVSLMPESVHMQMWVMSDRAIPRSYRMMQGFGVHTFRLVNAEGESIFVKFHWTPVAGTHSLDWDEAVKICGADADFHRRDLWEAIEAGAYPEWELGVQIFTEKQADVQLRRARCDQDRARRAGAASRRSGGWCSIAIPTTSSPRPSRSRSARRTSCRALDFSNDPLLAGRIHSYVDTQITRLGGPNFHEIPINAPIAQVHNNQRDGMHRQAIHRGRVAYEPNSLGGGCPFQAGMRGFTSFPEPVHEDKVRGKPEKFADHYTQATLFWNSQSDVEKAHIIRAFRFELTRVQTAAIRERVVSQLANVADEALPRRWPRSRASRAGAAADGGAEASRKPKWKHPRRSRCSRDQATARSERAGSRSSSRPVSRARRSRRCMQSLSALGAVPRFVAPARRSVATAEGDDIDVEVTHRGSACGAVRCAGHSGRRVRPIEMLSRGWQALEFVKDQYRHCKPILALGAGAELLDAPHSGLAADGEPDPGILRSTRTTMRIGAASVRRRDREASALRAADGSSHRVNLRGTRRELAPVVRSVMG